MKLRNSLFAGILFFIAYPFLAFSQSESENDQTQLNLKTGEVSHIVSKPKPQYPWDSFQHFSNFTLAATSDPRWDSIQLSRGHYFYSEFKPI